MVRTKPAPTPTAMRFQVAGSGATRSYLAFRYKPRIMGLLTQIRLEASRLSLLPGTAAGAGVRGENPAWPRKHNQQRRHGTRPGDCVNGAGLAVALALNQAIRGVKL